MAFKDEVKSFIEDNFMIDFSPDFTSEDSFLENGIIDSTGVLELVGLVEEKFGFQVQDEDLVPENLDSIDNLVSYVERKAV